MPSNLWTLNGTDILQSILNAVIVAIGAALFGIVSQSGFNLFQTDWLAVGQTIANVGFIALVTSLFGKFSTEKNGKLFGKI